MSSSIEVWSPGVRSTQVSVVAPPEVTLTVTGAMTVGLSVPEADEAASAAPAAAEVAEAAVWAEAIAENSAADSAAAEAAPLAIGRWAVERRAGRRAREAGRSRMGVR